MINSTTTTTIIIIVIIVIIIIVFIINIIVHHDGVGDQGTSGPVLQPQIFSPIQPRLFSSPHHPFSHQPGAKAAVGSPHYYCHHNHYHHGGDDVDH